MEQIPIWNGLAWPIFALSMELWNFQWYNYFVRRKHENMSQCTGSRVNTNHERIASWGGCQCWTGDPTVVASVLTTQPWPIRQNGLAPAERYHVHSCVHWLQQRVDSGQELFSTGLLIPGTGCRYYFVWRKHENMSPCTGSRVNTSYGRIASWGGCQCDPWNFEIFNDTSDGLGPSLRGDEPLLLFEDIRHQPEICIQWKHFRVTDPLCGDFTGPLTKARDAELWGFLCSAPEQTVE